jgi:hypothetical protein
MSQVDEPTTLIILDSRAQFPWNQDIMECVYVCVGGGRGGVASLCLVMPSTRVTAVN